jgi:hypothetical protein
MLEGHNYGILLRCLSDDGDASPGYVRRMGAGGEPNPPLREIMHDALPSHLPELARPVPEAQLLAVVFFNCEKPVSLIQRWL